MTHPISNKHSASFRDPAGFLFYRDQLLYRQVNQISRPAYDAMMSSGLYEALIKAELLIPHQEVSLDLACAPNAYKIIAPERLPFISYPYEWCFGELKDAALATCRLQKIALEHGMILKDASAYNIQFRKSKPVLIDTLSFEIYQEGRPWQAYRQFCQHFLAPLALMSYRDVRLNQLLRVHLDGIPLDLASKLLPLRTRLRFGLVTHLHLHASSQKKYEGKAVSASTLRKISKRNLYAIVDNLESTVAGLDWMPAGTEWGDYYNDTNYTERSMKEKERLVSEMIKTAAPRCLWDLGGNIGRFTRLACAQGIPAVCFDIDPAAVELAWRECKKKGDGLLLPLLSDLTNPAPAIGWMNTERDSLLGRGPADLVMGLALIHHLAISNNVPFDRLAEFFAQAGNRLIIEFVPKHDSQVQRLLATREDIFPDYDEAHFEAAFNMPFSIERKERVPESERTLYLMKKR